MKKYWHTGTLFIQWWKYKWSYKYEHCIWCGQCDKKHKWNWYCINCFDKQRKKKNPKRIINLKFQWLRHYYKKRVLLFLEKKERKKKIKTFDVISYRKQWYLKNKERVKLEKKWNQEKLLWNNVLEIITKKKTIYIPFMQLQKDYCNSYEEYKENQRKYNLILEFYK